MLFYIFGIYGLLCLARQEATWSRRSYIFIERESERGKRPLRSQRAGISFVSDGFDGHAHARPPIPIDYLIEKNRPLKWLFISSCTHTLWKKEKDRSTWPIPTVFILFYFFKIHFTKRDGGKIEYKWINLLCSTAELFVLSRFLWRQTRSVQLADNNLGTPLPALFLS